MFGTTRSSLLLVICLAVTVHGSAERLAKVLGERRQIFRDEVSHLKGMKRPVDSNYGYYEAEDETYRPIKPTYQDDYNPQYPGSYEPEYSKPTYQPDQDAPYQNGNYDDNYKPAYQEEPYYKPEYESEQKPPVYDDYKPVYQEDYNPTYEDEQKPTYQDDYKPAYEDESVPPFDVGYMPTFKPINFNVNFYNADDQRPPYVEDSYEETKPYGPAQDYDEYIPSKPVAQKPYKPETPKPYKPRPSYPKEIVMLKPSSALKSSAYADEYATPNYRPTSVPGTPGKDYPNYKAVPQTSFDCLSLKASDYSLLYPDLETGCQVFHSCHSDGRQDSFLCPLGTIFDGETQTCDWWYNTRCY